MNTAQEKRIAALDEEFTLVANERNRLSEFLVKMQKMIEKSINSKMIIEKNADMLKKIIDDSYTDTIALLREQNENIKDEMEKELNFIKEEACIVKGSLESEIKNLRAMNDGLNNHIFSQEEQLSHLSQQLKSRKEIHEKEILQLRSEISILKMASKQPGNLNEEKLSLSKELARISSMVNKKDEESRKLFFDKIKVIEELVLLKKSTQAENLSYEDFLNKNSDLDLNIISDEIKNLKQSEEEREKLFKQEKEALNTVLAKVKNSIKTIQQASENEAQSLAQELALINHKYQVLQADKDCLQKQRDEALLRITKNKGVDKTTKVDLIKLLEFMKSQEMQRNKLFSNDKQLIRK